MTNRLEGKTALITGTGGGQGRAAAVRFAAEGARIVGCDLNAEGQAETDGIVEAAGGRIASLAPLDLSMEPQVLEWINFAVESFGDFDILYNNASAVRFAPITEMTLDEWNFTIANELTLIFLVIKYAVPILARNGGGCIINTASIAGMGVSNPGGFAHSATKAGVIALTQSLAVELAPLGIRVNAISPGVISTPATQPLINSPGGEAIRDGLLVKRFGESEDIAATAAFLCSDEASYIDGATLLVDGGAVAVGALGTGGARSALLDM